VAVFFVVCVCVCVRARARARVCVCGESLRGIFVCHLSICQLEKRKGALFHTCQSLLPEFLFKYYLTVSLARELYLIRLYALFSDTRFCVSFNVMCDNIFCDCVIFSCFFNRKMLLLAV
jgi:hypothetical protein